MRGTGQRGRQVCGSCHGTTQVTRTETYQVKVPAGVAEGPRLRLSGKGEAGTGGGSAGTSFCACASPGIPTSRSRAQPDPRARTHALGGGSRRPRFRPHAQGHVSIRIPLARRAAKNSASAGMDCRTGTAATVISLSWSASRCRKKSPSPNTNCGTVGPRIEVQAAITSNLVFFQNWIASQALFVAESRLHLLMGKRVVLITG